MNAFADLGYPEGFQPLQRRNPLLDLLGPFLVRGEGDSLEVGLLLDERHTNSRGGVHGGILATLADIGMGYAMAFSGQPPQPLVTASLTLDYVSSAQVGDWLSIRLLHSRRGRQMAFANALLSVDDKVVAQASAVFAVPAQR
ncbi:PaaI family thioesterase [Pseudomonas nitroreducens]|uniref:PaaI family thioesterase n=1 Tax=Pseudomonas nitroreducens TaxID=46680 RepID=A0A6G6IY48_PSENT|nr:PaaI family thioesterase [Pseudomonas nitroreducens]MBG6286381.1 PaaI family thioesterase [Pseudomonas nitroreducens]QIE87942.1 PaaI family thioesterase [Pseudomonas nitroreducens]